MKKIIYSLLFVITAVCAACDEELPKASFDLYELKTLTATAGDMNVALSWKHIRTPVLMNILLAGLRALRERKEGK